MKNITRPRALTALGLMAGVLLFAGAGSAQSLFSSPSGFVTTSKPYMVSVSPEYSVQPLLSVGDRVPRTGNPAQEFQFVGIPDGMGAYPASFGRTVLYVNHEFVQGVISEPIIGEPLNRGTIVSKLVLARDGSVLSGDRAYDVVYSDDTLVGPAADVTNSTPAFSRFCSGSLEYRNAGFDRPIYFAGEESGGAATFDGLGGLAIAVFEEDGVGELHTIPKFGRFPWENTVAQPKKRQMTVLMGMEDGPATPDNQLYMYVGDKDYRHNATPMARNGLSDGDMFVFVPTTPGPGPEGLLNTEPELFALATPSNPRPSIQGHWVEINDPELLTDVQLEAASDAVNAFGFVRTEDGAFNPEDPDEYFFVTTGSGTPTNDLGALYRMKLDRRNPRGNTTIQLIYNANAVIAAGGDIAISPDNIGMDRNYIMINEDGTAQSRAVMAQKGRDGAVWRLKKGTYEATQIAELFPPGRDAIPTPAVEPAIGPGVWETTGVIPAAGFGGEAWFVNVQAHSPTLAPAPNTQEDGQLLLMRRTPFRALTP